jgi:hypothetical protein
MGASNSRAALRWQYVVAAFGLDCRILPLSMIDRRNHERIRLRCPVSLWKSTEGTFVRTETENLNCRGFFCYSTEPYLPGDDLQATVEVPERFRNDRGTGSLVLRCQVEVVRIERLQAKYGVACQVKDYTVIAVAPLVEVPKALVQ